MCLAGSPSSDMKPACNRSGAEEAQVDDPLAQFTVQEETSRASGTAMSKSTDVGSSHPVPWR